MNAPSKSDDTVKSGDTAGHITRQAPGQETTQSPRQETQQTPGQSPGLLFRRPDRLALDLRVRGLTYQQIAVVLNLSTTTAHKAVRRALMRHRRRLREALLSVAKVNRWMLREGKVDLRTVVREFQQARTPRQLGQLHQLEQRLVREKNGRTTENKPRGVELNTLAPNNLQLENMLANKPRTSSQENER
ncbi:MAG: hypothetical protein K8T91_18680 [Planctomycetes bacterium]|nr:hypothetical protein [Planctomycetota bacterium]